jgi:hypothetical protein
MLTFVRNNGQEAVQSRISLTAPHTLVSQYARGRFASYLYQSHPRRVLIVGPGGGAMVRFLTYHEPQMYIDCTSTPSRSIPPSSGSRTNISACAPTGTSACIPPMR